MWFSFWLLCCASTQEESAMPEPCLQCPELAQRQQLWLLSCDVQASLSDLERDCEVWGPDLQSCMVGCMESAGCSVSRAQFLLASDQENQACQQACFEDHGAR